MYFEKFSSYYKEVLIEIRNITDLQEFFFK